MSDSQKPLVYYATTELQKRCAALYEEGVRPKDIAADLGCHRRTVRKVMHILRARRASVDPSTHSDEAPVGYRLKGVSTQRRDPNGNLQWVKTEKVPVTQDPLLLRKVFSKALADASMPMAVPRGQTVTNEDLLTVIPLGDAHVGMVASALTSKMDYTLDQGVSDLVMSVQQLLDATPASGTALIISVGDFFHAADRSGLSPKSKHKLDIDPEWARVVRAGYECMLRIINMTREKCGKVIVDMREGNHDIGTHVFLLLALEAYYRNDPSVEIINDLHKVTCHTFGEIMIATTHGDSPRSEKLPEVLAAMFPKQWGNSTLRYAYTGHIHHKTVSERCGITLESLRVHSKPDAYSYNEGYNSQRGVVADVYDVKRAVHLCRHTVTLK